jgi:predicted transcriptional regulator
MWRASTNIRSVYLSQWGISLKRNPIQMKIAVLKECREPLKLTFIMYRTNVNAVKLKGFIRLLVSKGFLTEITITHPKISKLTSKRFLYQTTEKGNRVVVAFKDIEELIS